jgi:hypothetical protein
MLQCYPMLENRNQPNNQQEFYQKPILLTTALAFILALSSCTPKEEVRYSPYQISVDEYNRLYKDTAQNTDTNTFIKCESKFRVHQVPVCITFIFRDQTTAKTYRVDVPAFATPQEFNNRKLDAEQTFRDAAKNELRKVDPNLNVDELEYNSDYDELKSSEIIR